MSKGKAQFAQELYSRKEGDAADFASKLTKHLTYKY
jgi:hypothetical protein